MKQTRWTRGGFSYLEVLIAAAILMIIILPALSGFVQAQRNFEYAYQIYQANLYRQNLLLEGESALLAGKVTGASGELGSLLPGFVLRYDTDRYDYYLGYYRISGGRLSAGTVYATNPIPFQSVAASFASLSPNLFTQASPKTLAVLQYNDGFSSLSGNGFTLRGKDSCLLRPEQDGAIEVRVTRADRPFLITVDNARAVDLVLNIYWEPTISLDNLRIDYQKGSHVITCFYGSASREEGDCLVTAAVADKRTGMLKTLSKLAVPSVN